MTIFQLLKEMECQSERAAAEEHARQREELERRELVEASELQRREREAEEERRLQATQHAESLRLMQRQVDTGCTRGVHRRWCDATSLVALKSLKGQQPLSSVCTGTMSCTHL